MKIFTQERKRRLYIIMRSHDDEVRTKPERELAGEVMVLLLHAAE
jgi:hypothetical protein